ncbi:protein translocase subunit secB [Panacagrimonas perspica]|uniref:Protein-export protein SecB n=1 Tax=Panacagrimonas perspica TaxID=381431 RepID=A0A4S3K608_9GAMM|nr:protein-export chaperone SecB [Panacagrimonas perspica]TDU28051.1 protein translocase subunit secB [Panacagrimonas perspica]THD03468.1 protein-export chaperone SecB [Panacagrimonas perspica]
MAEQGPASGTADPAGQAPTRQVMLQKIYVKDASIEVPGAPLIFSSTAQPQIDVNVSTQTSKLEGDHFHIVITITVTAKHGDETVFLVEVQQGGVFLVSGFANNAERGAILGGYCPSLLFPFAREAVADFVQKAGFPQLLLQPINFEAMYLEHLARQRAEAEGNRAVADPNAAPAH